MWLNPDHEVFGLMVITGSAVSILGACVVSIDSKLILEALSVPDALAQLLQRRL
jgi:hypothetical protein